MRLSDQMPNHIKEEESRVYAELGEQSDMFYEGLDLGSNEDSEEETPGEG